MTTNLFTDFNHHFAVGEVADSSFTEGDAEVVGNCLGKFRIGIAREDHEIIRDHRNHDIARLK